MTATNLRAYNRDIEAMIDRGQNDDAVTHCKYILKYFPKHVGTYRLLGKAFLESHHYSEAADILQRVLSVIPDDFISHIGMSIIREDEGNLDAAIWHMERAFEVQPSNTAVQGELRRLYGLRDGIEPPKVRLTRGALVRMYAKSDLYPQAIAELLAALAEDPQRVDLETILAQMYFQSGKKIEAAEICSRLISKLPYCLEANKLLAEILPASSRAEEAKIFNQRLISLDPYYGHISSTVPLADDVPDNAITLERFEAVSQDTRIQPLISSSLPANVEMDQQDKIPDWLPKNQEVAPVETPFQPAEKTVASEQQISTDQVGTNKETPPMNQDAPVPPMDNQIPDWMREAGWAQSEDTPSESAGDSSKPGAGQEEEEIVPAELPEWLKSMAPAEDKESSPANQQEKEKLGLLGKIFPKASIEASTNTAEEETAFESTGGAVTQLFSEEAIHEAEKSAQQSSGTSPILPNAAIHTNDKKVEHLPEWLSEPEVPKAESPEAVSKPFIVDEPASQPMQNAASKSGESRNTQDWLESLAKDNPPAPMETPQVSKPLIEESQADWVKGMSTESEANKFGSPLENVNLAPAKPLEEEVSSALPAENIPEWLKQQPATNEEAPAFPSETFQEPAEELPQPDSAISEPQPEALSAAEKISETTAKEELPDWLQELENNQLERQTVQPAPATTNIDPSLKEWLDTLDAQKEAKSKVTEEPEAPKFETMPQPEATVEVPMAQTLVPQIVEALPEVKAGETVSPQSEEAVSLPTEPSATKTFPSPVAAVETTTPVQATPEQPQQKAPKGKKRPPTSINPDAILTQARDVLAAGKANEASDLYTILIRANEKLEDIVHDLQDASHQYPLDVSIWQTLGDCYAKNKQLQEALNAYTKAEELLR
jgi:tetratricopeptide (TPR) repeat protein